MRHFLLAVILLPTALFHSSPEAEAQNVQLHYDFGRTLYSEDYGSRPLLTSTVEMFRTDAWGSTFFFIDMDYTGYGITGAYWEIARELSFRKSPFSLHVEYNGGIMSFSPLQNAYLGGLAYTGNNKDFSRGFSVSAMYKHIQRNPEPHNFQLTGTWYANFGKNGLYTFSGFADWWREKTEVGNFIFMAEPQCWINLNKIKGVDSDFNLSIGSEVELTHNFSMHKGFYVIPTLAVKWTFQ
jgi:hypothetical protein